MLAWAILISCNRNYITMPFEQILNVAHRPKTFFSVLHKHFRRSQMWIVNPIFIFASKKTLLVQRSSALPLNLCHIPKTCRSTVFWSKVQSVIFLSWVESNFFSLEPNIVWIEQREKRKQIHVTVCTGNLQNLFDAHCVSAQVFKRWGDLFPACLNDFNI